MINLKKKREVAISNRVVRRFDGGGGGGGKGGDCKQKDSFRDTSDIDNKEVSIRG